MEETLHLPELELNCVAELCDIVTVAVGDVNKQAAIVGSALLGLLELVA